MVVCLPSNNGEGRSSALVDQVQRFFEDSYQDVAFSGFATHLVALEAILAELNRDRGLKLLVKAFADGRERDPDPLSTRRANVIVEWLVARGIDADRLSALGCGSVRPLTFGETESERARNRRAELVRQTATAGCEPPW